MEWPHTKMRKADRKLSVLLWAKNRRIVSFLSKRDRANVTQIYTALTIPQCEASMLLNELEKFGYVHADREGKFTYYSLIPHAFEEVVDIVDQIVSHQIKRKEK